MPDCAFIDKTAIPTPQDVAKSLTPIPGNVWKLFLNHLHEVHDPVIEHWKFMNSGWTLVPKKHARTICYLFPAEGYFTAAFTFGSKAVAAARRSKLPKRILTAMEEARPYAEGRGFYVKCSRPADLHHLFTLAALKMDS
jgi:hypothetical protein